MLVKYFLCLIVCLFALSNTAWAQFPHNIDSTSTSSMTTDDSSKIHIIHIGTLKEKITPQGSFKDLIGNVHLRQQEMHLWCDLGFILPNRQVKAYDNVQMLQDSVRIFSDSLFYDGIGRQAQLRQNVVLKDSSMTMFTEKLDYDLNTRIATFPEESLIESDTTTMVSKRGYYNVNTNIAHFSDSVRITNPNYKLVADSLAFNTQTEVALILGPTTVFNKDKMVYCEDGFYDSDRNYAELYKNARFENRENGKKEIATGDTIIYDGDKDTYYLIGNAHFENEDQAVDADTILMDGRTEEYFFKGNPKFTSLDTTENQSIDAIYSNYDLATNTMIFRGDVRVEQESQIIMTDSLDYNTKTKTGIAKGNVIWQDTSAKMQINCGEAYYNDSTKFLLAKDNPVLRTMIENDSMWLRADTLISFADSNDIDTRHLKAYNHVKIYKEDLQAICDSLYYDGIDSVFHFYNKPILWVDEVQFTADTIDVQMRLSKINQVLLHDNSFITNTREETYFNQIKGEDVVTHFKDGKINTMDINNNGETVYYALDDDDSYMMVNDVDCNNMVMYFGSNQIKRIRFEGTPKAVLYPMDKVEHSTLELEGFQWLDSLRIKSKYELLGINIPTVLNNDTTTQDSSLFSLLSSIDSLSTPIDSSSVSTLPKNTIPARPIKEKRRRYKKKKRSKAIINEE